MLFNYNSVFHVKGRQNPSGNLFKIDETASFTSALQTNKRRVPDTQLTKKRPVSPDDDTKHYKLVLATTIGNSYSLRAETILNNTIQSYINMGLDFYPIVFTTNERYTAICNEKGIKVESTIEENPYHLPYFKWFIDYVQSHYKSDFYGYTNSDILFHSKILNVLDTIKQKQTDKVLQKKILLVGRRLNYNIYENMTIPVLPGLFDKFLEDIYFNSEVFTGLAMDYFITTPYTFGSDLSPVVIGRPMIDSYLFHYAYSKEDIDVVDCSDSIIAVHETDENGNWRGHGNDESSQEDIQWNSKFYENTRQQAKTTLAAPFKLAELSDDTYYLYNDDGWDDAYTDAEIAVLKKHIPENGFCLYYGNGRMKGVLTSICKYVIYMIYDTNLPGYEGPFNMKNRMRILKNLNHTNNGILPSCSVYKDYITYPLFSIPEPPKEYYINIWKKYDAIIIDGPCKQEIAYYSSYNIRFRDTSIIIHGSNIHRNKNVNLMAGFRFIDKDNTTDPHLGMVVYQKKMFKILPEYRYLSL
ncbi:hypothetical protein WA158_004279 [Blastocystis sp. Blastoise]